MRIRAPGFRLGAASSVAFSSSGELLGQVGRKVAAYSVRDRRIAVRSDWHYPHPAAITFGAREEWFAVRSTTGAIAVAATEDGHPRDRLPPPSDAADDSPLRTAPDDHLVEACSSGTLRVRRLSGLAVEYVEQHPDHILGAIDATPDQSLWVVAVNRKQLGAPAQPPCRLELRRWPFATAHRQVLRDDLGFIHAVAINAHHHSVAVVHRPPSARGYTITCISVDNGATLRESTSTNWSGHQGFAWSPDVGHIVIGTRSGHALLSARLEPVGHLAGEYPSDAAFSPDGTLLALGYWGHGIVIPTSDLRQWFTSDRAPV